MGSFQFTGGKISTWESAGIFNDLGNSKKNAVGDSGGDLPDIKDDGRLYVYLSGNHFQQNKVIIANNDNVINIYCVYEMQPIASSRDTTYTIQNALFGAMQITKDAADNSKNNYKGYGICFDERSQFGHTITENSRAHTTDGRIVLIFGVDMSLSVQATNRANNIYYLKNICKTGQLVKEKLCIGNLSDQWTASESEKTGLLGNIYDFLVDYQAVLGVNPIYDMHRYLMTKHNIRP